MHTGEMCAKMKVVEKSWIVFWEACGYVDKRNGNELLMEEVGF